MCDVVVNLGAVCAPFTPPHCCIKTPLHPHVPLMYNTPPHVPYVSLYLFYVLPTCPHVSIWNMQIG